MTAFRWVHGWGLCQLLAFGVGVWQEVARGGPIATGGRVALSLPAVSFEATALGLGVGPVAAAPMYPSAGQFPYQDSSLLSVNPGTCLSPHGHVRAVSHLTS